MRSYKMRKRFSLIRISVLGFLTCVALLLGYTLQSSAYYPSGAPCGSIVFSDVSPATWTCIKEKLTAKGFVIPNASSGEITSSDATADFALNASSKTLTITVKTHSYTCEDINRAITETVDSCKDFEKVTLIPGQATRKLWRIDAPNVKERQTAYPQIRFKRGDKVTVTAGGCVQHGGPGKTWALYVDPQKQNPTPDFYGLIELPGMPTFVKLKDFLADGGTYQIPNSAIGDMFLKLGFSDFRYEDNGYWGREGDDGFANQCVNQPNAWVEIKIVP